MVPPRETGDLWIEGGDPPLVTGGSKSWEVRVVEVRSTTWEDGGAVTKLPDL